MADAVTPTPSKRARTSVASFQPSDETIVDRGSQISSAATVQTSDGLRQVLKVGCTSLHPLVLGHTAAEIPQKFLSAEHFYVGELVSVRREDDRRTVGLLRAVNADTIVVDCGDGVMKTILAAHVPECLGKLLRAHYLALGPCKAPRLAHTFGSKAQELELGGTLLRPVRLGQNCQDIDRKGGLGLDNFYLSELVSVTSSDGRVIIGEVVNITTQLVTVSTGSGCAEQIAAADVRSMLCKLLGNYYLAASLLRDKTTDCSGSVSDRIQEQIDEFFRRQNEDNILGVFAKYGSKDSKDNPNIPEACLIEALNVLNVNVGEDEAQHIFSNIDGNDKGFVELEELKNALFPPSPVEAWAHSLHLPRLLCFALPSPLDPEIEPLRGVSMLNEEDIKSVTDGFCDALNRILTDRIRRLQNSFKAMDSKAAEEGAERFKMSNCGSIEDFHLGLHGRIGATRLDSNLTDEMEAEHCTKGGSDCVFDTQKPDIKTTPRAEWDIVMKRMSCPKEHRPKRKIPDIDQLLELDEAKKSKLTKSEVIALVLYTGPMYQVYNTILRRHPAKEYDFYKAKGNLFCTTISVIVSALIKISRAVKVHEGKLYRGLGGTELPDSFFQRDASGCRGYTEWAFMSTSSTKQVAISYSGLKQRRPVPLVLEVRVGSVDRGANIQPFSQYSHQKEFLFVPCSFLQQDGQEYLEVTDVGVVRVFPIRVNSNLKAMTIDEQVEHRKKTHITSFQLLIDSISENLYDIANDRNAQERFESDLTKDSNQSVEGFISQIVAQCKQVLARHEAEKASQYSQYHAYQGLVREMVDVKGMAIAKLEEWLENTSSSFIRFRWNAPLRTVNRRWIAYLEKQVLRSTDKEDKKKAAIRLCKAKRLIAATADETNDLGETKLMAAAADGYSEKILRLLVDAAADVNFARPDGVTPVWLAAQFGHDECIQALKDLHADVTKAANDGATPVYIAAQNGNSKCIRLLKELKVDVNQADRKGVTPVHQAAMNGWVECIVTLHELGADLLKEDLAGTSPAALAYAHQRRECVQKLHELNSVSATTFPQAITRRALSSSAPGNGMKSLIISTGDISDVDGFYALAEYAKSGADVIFVMNYPAYIGVNDTNSGASAFTECNPGLGYRYSAAQVLSSVSNPTAEYLKFLSSYGKNKTDNDRMKCAMTDIAFRLACDVWQEAEVSAKRGQLLFCIGGINSVNPFSATAIKNEVLVYSHLAHRTEQLIDPLEGAVYNENAERCEVCWMAYSDIYIDFNGSMAFWNESWVNRLSGGTIAHKLRGAFVMGGVYADRPPTTMPSIPNKLNRFSSATMNQLYHPQRAAEFFAFLKQNKVDIFTITNNVIGDLTTYDKDGKTKNYHGVSRFLRSNGLTGNFLQEIAKAHYLSVYDPPRKAFDFYTAVALRAKMKDPQGAALKSRPRTLLHSNVYGMTFVSEEDSWEATRCSYIRNIDTAPNATDLPFVRAKKETFLKEIDIINSIAHLEPVPVFDVDFELDEGTMVLRVAAPTAESQTR